MCEDTDKFWDFIERKMACNVPKYLQNILRLSGFENSVTIKTLTIGDIQELREFARKKMERFMPRDAHKREYFGEYWETPDDFEIMPGHVRLLQEIAKFVSATTASYGTEGKGFHQPTSKPNLNAARTDAKNIGNLMQVPIRRENYRLVNGSPKARPKPQPSTMGSCGILSKHNNVEVTSTPSSQETDLYSDLQQNVFSNIVLFLQKHSSGLYEQFSGKFTSKIVEVNISIICPICGEKFQTKTMISNGLETKNISLTFTEFKDHMEHHSMSSDSSLLLPTPSLSTLRKLDDSQELSNITTSNDDWDDQLILNSLVKTAEKNMLTSKPGYRFDLLIKMFACYIKLLAGLLAYETLQANLPRSLPSSSTVDRFIRDKGPKITEGVLRTDEPVKYLTDRKLPLRVAVSEDATRITAKVSYDVNSNQLVGFALPLNKNGMPIPFSFEARNTKEIQKHFSNQANFVSSNVIVQMAQPQSTSFPPFCLTLFLTDNNFTGENILSRWNFTSRHLLEKGLQVDNYSTDGDSRYLKVMKFKSEIGITDLSFFNCEWFSCGSSYKTTFTQVTTHIGTKARNRLLKVSRRTPIGSKIVSITHLQYLMENVSKDKHLLTPHDIEPKDRQNFLSVEKICSLRVISCLLEYVPDSEGTAMFLKALNYSLYSYLDTKMNATDRVYKIWYAIFFFRVWRQWLLKSKDYTLKESFISSNLYTCIEINGHTLVKQILKSRKDQNYLFMPYKQGSQQCEGTYRQLRSMSSTFSTVVNCTMIDFLNRIKKIQLLSDISHACFGKIKFPRQDTKENNMPDASSILILPNETEIITLIEKAKNDLSRDVSSLGIDTEKLDFHCQVKATNFEGEFHYDDTEEEDESDDDDEIIIESDEELDEELHEDLDKISGLTGELLMTDYSTPGIELDEKGPFCIVKDNTGKETVVRKSSLCWLLSKNRYKLSSDRLQRVMEKEYQQTGKLRVTRDLSTGFVKSDELFIGEWCVFNTDHKLMVGLILGFCYTDGKTFKERAYTKMVAQVGCQKAVGILCTWYSWSTKGELKNEKTSKHTFVDIKQYKGTILSPVYCNKKLQLCENVLKHLKKLKA